MKKPIRLFAFIILSLIVKVSSAQTCNCTDCPVDILNNQTVTSVLDVTSLSNSTLNSGGQGVCEVSIEFDHSWLPEVEMILFAPNGSSIFLIPDGIGGNTGNSTWDITFVPCGDPVFPDAGAGNEFNSVDFNPFTNYTGSYYPGNGCFDDLSGSANGMWTLQIEDVFNQDEGQVFNWSITFCDATGLDCDVNMCAANMGTFNNSTQIFCDTDNPIEAAPIVTGGNTSGEYTTTWVISSDITGSTSEILGYSETADFTGYPSGDYFICGLNYLTSDAGVLPATNAGNNNSTINDLIGNGSLCAVFGFACASVIINDCGCDAESGNINISNLTYCATDAIDLNPTVNNQNTDTDYGYTFTVSNYTSGSIGTLAGYTETGDLTGYPAGSYWVCGLSYLTTDEPLLPAIDGVNSNLDIQDDIADETICADLAPGCYIVAIESAATLPVLDFDSEICVGEASSVTVTNYDPDALYAVIINSGSFAASSIGTPTTTFTPFSDVDIEICIINFSTCGDLQACANITVNGSSSNNLMIDGLTGICPGNFLNYTLNGLGNSTIDGWTISGDASIVGSTTGDNVDVQIDNVATTGEAELCIDATNECAEAIQECFIIDIIDNELANATFDNFCDFDIFIEVLIDGTFGSGVWTVVSAPGNVIYDNVNNSQTDIVVDAYGDYILQFNFQCGQSIEVPFTVYEPIVVTDLVEVCTGNTYTVSFNISGGLAPYFIDGFPIIGNSYMSEMMGGDTYQIFVEGSATCNEVELLGDPDCGCDSNAGSINPQSTLESCEGETVTATNNGDAFLESDDIGIWILYSDSTDPLGSIISENTTGDFSFAAPLNYGTTYFIAYIVGNEIGGTVDLLDPCIDIADGTSVIFFEPFGLTDVTVVPLNSCNTQYELTAVQDSPLDGLWVITITPTGGSGTVSTISGSSTIITLEGEGTFTVQYSVTNGFCSAVENINIDGPDLPESIVISTNCASDNLSYQVTLVVSGGTQPYSVGGVPFFGSTFISNDIASGDSYSFIFTDDNGCVSDEISGSFFCDCESDAGNMSSDLIEICGDGNATVVNDGNENLDGNDGLVYILHTNSGTTLGTVLDENQTGTFSFLPSMNYEETYYISAAVGNASGTSIDITDDCLSVANGQAIIWYEELIINSLTSDFVVGCEDFNITIDANTTIEGVWSVNSSPTGATVIFNTSGSITGIIVDIIGTYNLQYEITNGTCTAVETVTITLSEAPTISNITYECDGTNDNYQVSFDISGGVSPYTVNGESVIGSTYTSAFTPNGVSMDYSATDFNGCVSDIITTNNNCSVACVSDAGSMSGTLIEICGDGNVTSLNDGNEILEGNDALIYILHTNSSNFIGTILDENQTGTFSLLPSMSYEVTYYVSAVAADANGTSVDFTDDCLNIASGQPVMWYEEIIINNLTSDASASCEDFNITVDANTDILGEWTIISTPMGGNVNFNTVNNLTNVIVDVVGSYVLQYEITNGPCNDSDQIIITLNGTPTINNVSYECDLANENYQVSFDIMGGLLPYVVNGLSVTGSTFTSPITPNGLAVEYTVTDVNGCMSNIITNHDCSTACISDAGTMPQVLIETCYDTIGTQPIIQIVNEGNSTLDSDDIGIYILHLGDANVITSPIAESATGVFQNLGSIPYNTQLYISYVVGDEINSTVDLSDPCLSVSVGQPIIFYQTPRVSLGEDISICSLEINLQAGLITGNDANVEWNNLDGPIGGNMLIGQNNIDNVDLTVNLPGTYTISLTAVNNINLSCIASDTIEITFIEVPSVSVMDDFNTCISTIEVQSTKSIGTGVWSIPDLPNVMFNSSLDTTSITLDTFGIFQIIRTISNEGCIISDTLTVEIFPSSDFAITGIECDDNNENYTLIYEIIGNSYPYTINGEVINEGETANLTSASGSGINIVVLDSNMCEIYNDDITRSCDCESELEDNLQNIIRSCIQDTMFIPSVENFILEEGDSLVYVLHSSPTNTIDNIIAASGNPFFLFDSNSMNTVIPYFVSAVIYSGGTFSLDALDLPCTQVDLRRPVFWYGPSQTIIEDQTINICEGDSVIIPITHTGAIPIIVGISNTSGVDFQIEITEEGITEVLVPMNENGFVSISYVVPLLFCDNTFSGLTTVNILETSQVQLEEGIDICSDINNGNTQINLSDLIISSSSPGVWADADGTEIIDTQIDFENVAEGSYEYTFTTSDLGCGSAMASTMISVTDCGECPTDVIIQLPTFCQGATAINLNEYVTSAYNGIGTWVQVEGTVITPLNDPIVIIPEDYVGSEDYVYWISGLSDDCDSLFTNTLTVVNTPNAGTSSGVENTFCAGETTIITLFNFIIDYDLGGVWSSISTDQFDINNGQLNLPDLSVGNYIFEYTVPGNSECPPDINIVLIEIIESEFIDFIVTDPLCFGENDGSVVAIDINGNPVNNTYQIIDSEGNIIEDQNTLFPGLYTYFGEGNNGCTIQSEFTLNDPIELLLDLGLDIVINEGETVTINANTNLNEDNIDLYQWLVNQSSVEATSYESLLLNPNNETTVELSITDDNGCIVADDLLLTILFDKITEVEVILPNIFNGSNSEFGIEAFSKIASVTSFAIYDRWGNRVFLAEDYNPASANQKWDGNYNGSSAVTGVYVYSLQYMDIDGNSNQVSGDITLIR